MFCFDNSLGRCSAMSCEQGTNSLCAAASPYPIVPTVFGSLIMLGHFTPFMKTNEENMTPAQAAGYITGVGLSFIRRYYRAFAILLALGGLALILTNVSLTIAPTRFNLKLGDSALIGVVMLVMSIGLWLLFRSWRKQ